MIKRELLSHANALETEYSAILAAASSAFDPIAHLAVCDAKEIELNAVREKLAKNAIKYPVEKSKGRADKYDQL